VPELLKRSVCQKRHILIRAQNGHVPSTGAGCSLGFAVEVVTVVLVVAQVLVALGPLVVLITAVLDAVAAVRRLSDSAAVGVDILDVDVGVLTVVAVLTVTALVFGVVIVGSVDGDSSHDDGEEDGGVELHDGEEV